MTSTILRQCTALRCGIAASALLGSASFNLANASGFALPEISIAGLGSANALVANPDDPGAFAYNPAAMAFHQQSSMAVGGNFISPDMSVRTSNGKHDSQGADWLAAPTAQLALKLNDQWWAGFGISAPFGLETRWPLNSFPALTHTTRLPTGATVPISPQPTQSKLEVINFSPTATYLVNDALSLSAGADLYWLKSAALNSSLTDLNGDGTGWGFNLSALYKMDRWSLGANFHSASTVDVTGQYRPLNADLVALSMLTGGSAGLAPAQNAQLDLHLPWRLQLGARYIISPKLAMEFDWTRTGWSEFDRIKVNGRSGGTVLFDDQNQWEDSNAYRLGFNYQLEPATILRFGYAYDEKAQPDEHFSARVPDSDRHMFSIGVGHSLAQGWRIDAGYMYVLFEDRKIRGTTTYNPFTAPGEVNGTTALAGDYDGRAHLIGVEVSKRF